MAFDKLLKSLKKIGPSVKEGAQNFIDNITNKPLIDPTATPYDLQKAGRMPIATPTLQPSISKEKYVPRIEVNGKYGNPQVLPPETAQTLLNHFNDIGEATNAAQVLVHPLENTRLPSELARGMKNNFNYGENPELDRTSPKKINKDKTYDTGLMRLNSGTFKEMQDSAFWGNKMIEKGITNYDELESNPELNAAMARLMLEYANWDAQNQKIMSNPNWRRWYAAPKKLRIK